MTHTELTEKLKYDLDDLGMDFFTTEDLNNAILNALNKYTLLNGTCELFRNFSLQPNIPYYDFYNTFPGYFCVAEAYSKSAKQYLAFRTPVQLMQIREDYELWKGSPQFITVVDFRRVGFFPVSTSPVELVLKLKLSESPVINPPGDLYIPAHGEDLVLNFAKQELLEHAEEITKAANVYNQSVEELKGNKRFTNGRHFPNFCMSMLGIDLKTFSPLS